jgi:hypothetical protein
VLDSSLGTTCEGSISIIGGGVAVSNCIAMYPDGRGCLWLGFANGDNGENASKGEKSCIVMGDATDEIGDSTDGSWF